MLIPVGHKILIKPDTVEKEHAVEGTDIKLQLVLNERLEQGAQVRGTLVAAGADAWKAFGKDFTGKPWATPGDRIYYSKYAGKTVVDPEAPEVYYLVMLDEDVNCIIKGEESRGRRSN
jgi:co-chaperonin GroES (HSP10)